MVLGFNRPFAHPTSSFNEPVLPPSTEPDEGEQVQVCFSVEWLPHVLGALSQLLLQTTWIGDPDEVLLAQGRATNLTGLFANPVCAIQEVDTPFWDDTSGDDADDIEPVDEQPWYGVWDGESFVEAISYWAVTAFLATGISEGAAIEFITPLRTFRLRLKANPHGAKLLLFMDSNLFQLIDLFSATDTVKEVTVVSPGSTLMLVHSGEHNDDATPDANGNYVVQVIKGELSETDVVPALMRFSTTTPYPYQTTPDGGTTWNDNPQGDPRTNPAYLLPPLDTYSGIECDVAARMTAQLQDTLDIFIASGDAAQAVTGWIALLVFPLGWVGWALDILIAIANLLIDTGQAAVEAAFTSTVYDDIRCTLSCYIDDTGRISQADLDTAYDIIKAQHTGTVATVIDELRLFFGDVPMVNAGVSRDETGDCSGCDNCFFDHTFAFSTGQLGWTVGSHGAFGGSPTHFGGSIVGGTHTELSILRSWSSARLVTRVHVTYEVNNLSSAEYYPHVLLYFNTTLVEELFAPAYSSGANKNETLVYECAAPSVVNNMRISMINLSVVINNIYTVRLEGIGSDPF